MAAKKSVIKNVIASKAKQSGSVKIPKKIAASPKAPRNDNKLSVPVYSLAGRAAGTLSLPKEIFGAKVNQKLLAQAIRVYTSNEARLPGSTKKRGEVHGTTAKMYRQKGTGRARHGAKTAPIFVGGGVAFGPKPRSNGLSLPQKMRKASLVCALSAKAAASEVSAISGAEKASGKTKQVVELLQKLNAKSALIVIGEKSENLQRAAKNIPNVAVLPYNMINAYEVLRYQVLLVTKEGVEKLK